MASAFRRPRPVQDLSLRRARALQAGWTSRSFGGSFELFRQGDQEMGEQASSCAFGRSGPRTGMRVGTILPRHTACGNAV